MKKSKENGHPVYDDRMRARAMTTATLRAVVTLYIMYLGSEVMLHAGDESTTMPFWGSMIGGIALIVAAAAFGIFVWNQYQRDLEAARLLPPEETKEAEAPGEAGGNTEQIR